jgi:ABC-type bacteriocin/lantibiotic exporter with double-glycine peptidase domain
LDEIWIDRANTHHGDLWPTIWHEYFERTLMRNHRSYEVAHELACRLEITLREGTYFILPVGNFRQSEGYCGPAAIKIYLNYLGKNLSERYIGRLCRTTVEKGTDPAAIEEAVQKLGFRIQRFGRPLTKREVSRFCRASGVEGEELHNLIEKVREQAGSVAVQKAWTAGAVKKSIRKGQPVLANIQTSREYGSGHYVLLIGFSKDHFVLSDPGDDYGYREVPISEFMELWYELEDGTVREGFAIDV